jgi:myo-inositol-1(or 4)-monophosphatase
MSDMGDFGRFLDEMAAAADVAYRRAMASMTASERSLDIGLGGDGTPTMLLDRLIEEPVLDVIGLHGANVLSEEVGWIDRGSSITVVIDPVDGTANSAAGVPISAFAAAIVIDDVIVESLCTWLGTDHEWRAHIDDPQAATTSGRTSLSGSSISLLRPRPTTWKAWSDVARAADRLRILGSSVIEGCLVASGAIDAFCDPGGDVHRIVDIAPTKLIVEKAGGCVRDLKDRPFTFEPDLTLRWSGVIASTADLAEEIIYQVNRTTSD